MLSALHVNSEYSYNHVVFSFSVQCSVNEILTLYGKIGFVLDDFV